jgi:hypothetical protein
MMTTTATTGIRVPALLLLLALGAAGCTSGDHDARKPDGREPAARAEGPTAGSRPCDGNSRLRELTDRHTILSLCAGADVVAGADLVCAATFGADWVTFEPRDLAGRLPSARVTAGIDWLCAAIAALPYRDGLQAVARLESWVAAHLAVQELAGLGSEALATAVAFVPAVADLLPVNIESRAPRKEDVGASLASAEHTALHHALARRLSTMTEAERKAILDQLRERTTTAALTM